MTFLRHAAALPGIFHKRGSASTDSSLDHSLRRDEQTKDATTADLEQERSKTETIAEGVVSVRISR